MRNVRNFLQIFEKLFYLIWRSFYWMNSLCTQCLLGNGYISTIFTYLYRIMFNLFILTAIYHFIFTWFFGRDCIWKDISRKFSSYLLERNIRNKNFIISRFLYMAIFLLQFQKCISLAWMHFWACFQFILVRLRFTEIFIFSLCKSLWPMPHVQYIQ